MGHRAYIFDWPSFENELLPAIAAGLEGDVDSLKAFVADQRGLLVDPATAEPLGDLELEAADVDRLGQIAMTRFYDPTADHGLGRAWDELVSSLSDEELKLLLGEPVKVARRTFCEGTVFQSNGRVRISYKKLRELDRPELRSFARTLRIAGVSQRGLMVRVDR
jgi:hypothetical protein